MSVNATDSRPDAVSYDVFTGSGAPSYVIVSVGHSVGDGGNSKSSPPGLPPGAGSVGGCSWSGNALYSYGSVEYRINGVV